MGILKLNIKYSKQKNPNSTNKWKCLGLENDANVKKKKKI